jgi:hypothetical protein
MNGHHGHTRGWRAALALATLLAATSPSPVVASSEHPGTAGATAPASLCPVDQSSRGWCGDGGPAILAHLNDPHQIAPLASGGFLVADTGNNVIRKVDAAGIISTVAGTPFEPGNSGDGGAATAAKLNAPMGVADLGGGAYAIADTGNGVVRIVNAAGDITTRAPKAGFREPRTVTTIGNGDLLVVDAAQHRIFRLSRAGIRDTVAGTVGAGPGGDGGPATEAQLNRPTSVAIDQVGALLIADSGNRRVRRVALDGTITTVAGADGGLSATTPLLRVPTAVGFRADGAALIGAGPDVQLLSGDGMLQRIAGTGRSGFDVDAGPASTVTVGQVTAVAPAVDGSLLIADGDDDRVRRLTTDGKLLTVAGTNPPLPQVVVAHSGGSGPPTQPPANKGNCPGKRSSRSFRVSFFYLTTPTARPGLVRVRIRVTDNATVRVQIAASGRPNRTVARPAKSKVNVVRLVRLKAGRYRLRAQASTGGPAKRRVYSCATASLTVR